MRPLARKIFLTQGIVVLLVFGVSIFAWLRLQEAKRRADLLYSDNEMRLSVQFSEFELRDVERNRAFYFTEKRLPAQDVAQVERFKSDFYDSLDRVAAKVEEFAAKGSGSPELSQAAARLRVHLRGYRRAIAQQELAVALEDDARFEAAESSADRHRDEMRQLTSQSRQRAEERVKQEIGSLRQATRVAAALSLLFCGLAVAAGVTATFWLTRSIHGPVRDLRLATEALSRGEFDRRIDVSTPDELGDLARAFNEMAARLQELDELKSGFVSMVSHDLKTPLTSMKEAVELLAEGVGGELNERQKRLLSITRDGMERLSNYVQGILDLFRFEAGHVRLVREPLSLSEVVDEQLELVQARCREAGIVLRRDLETDLPLVEGDRFRLGQVVANLLDNAVKFTARDGSIRVRTGVAPWDDDLGVVLEVSDTGAGIAGRDLKHVFDKFFQAPGPQRRPAQGAGLGLAIVKSLVEAHGGEVTVDSTVGRGTTFRVLLPAAARVSAGRALAG